MWKCRACCFALIGALFIGTVSLPAAQANAQTQKTNADATDKNPLDWLSFIVRMVEALAWPGCVVLVVLMFKDRIGKLIDRLKSFKGPGGFEATLHDIKTKADDINLPQPDELESGPAEHAESSESRYDRIAERSPDAAVLEIWRDVENAVAELFRRARNTNPDSSHDHQRLLREMVGEGKLEKEVLEIYLRLRAIRNDIAHSEASGQSAPHVQHWRERVHRLVRAAD